MPMVSVGFTTGWFDEALPESGVCCMDEVDEES